MTDKQEPAPAGGKFDDDEVWGDEADPIDALGSMSDNEILEAIRQMESEMRSKQNTMTRIKEENRQLTKDIERKQERIKKMMELPYLVATVGELVDPLDDDTKSQAAGSGLGGQVVSKKPDPKEEKGKAVIVKIMGRQSFYLPTTGMLDHTEMKPGDLIAVNKDSYIVYEKLPPEYDQRVKAMEVDERPTEEYSDVGGLDKQIEEMVEAIVLPMTQKERFTKLGIRPPKGLLMYGAPGTGKTLMARACAAQTKATFLKLAGPQLVQMYIGDGARIVRDAFELARAKSPCIIFIDEIDAVGGKRGGDGENREVHRTMMELLN